MTNPNLTFAATTARGIQMLFVADPAARTIACYDRRYAGQPGFTEHGQACGPAFALDAFTLGATDGIVGWHDVDEWDLDAHTVRLVAAWLTISPF